ncbi:hypothetical protein [Bacillus sp. 03113]|uniref:hypothetical protein n=1 Tax=Bacillus sp. 03113 TaxID=2578211 RepID=UPI0011426F7F|nr:hypothetical protein [Bacillus sp. 03113]
MKGTAILVKEDQNMAFIENVEHSTFVEMKENSGDSNCNCKLDNKMVNYGKVSPVYWYEDEVDWDYGY